MILASTYGGCAYNSGNYDNSSCKTTQQTGDTSGGILANTGFDIALIVTVASVLILVALIVRIWKRPAKQPSK